MHITFSPSPGLLKILHIHLFVMGASPYPPDAVSVMGEVFLLSI